MSEIIRGRNCRVEVGSTEDTPLTVTAVSLASPGVATSAAHGLSNGQVGYFQNVVGMDELEGQVVRVSAVDTNTFTLEGFSTVGFGTFVSGEFVAVDAWQTLSQASEYQLGGGAGTLEDSTVLLDRKDKQVLITQGVESCTINVRALDEDNPAMATIRARARALDYLVHRITLSSGAQRVLRGQPSLPGESLAVKGLGTGSLTVAVIGDVLYLPAL